MKIRFNRDDNARICGRREASRFIGWRCGARATDGLMDFVWGGCFGVGMWL